CIELRPDRWVTGVPQPTHQGYPCASAVLVNALLRYARCPPVSSVSCLTSPASGAAVESLMNTRVRMEFLLLWIDEMDDALGALRHMAPRILGLLLALALFATTGFGLVLAPHVTLTALAVVL